MSDIRIKMAKDLRDMSDMVGDLHWMAAKAVEDLIKKDARIVELGVELEGEREAARDGNAEYLELQSERDFLHAELAAIKAQEPVAVVHAQHGFCWYEGRKPTPGTNLYAAPVSEAKVQGVYSTDPLACSGCASGCFRCRDGAKAQGVVMPERLDVPDASYGDSSYPAYAKGWNDYATEYARLNAAPVQQVSVPFQSRVLPWLLECFGEVIASDAVERNHRFLEEALELVQACGCTADESHKLVDYVYGRPVGEKSQEVGGVMVTLAALCLAQGMDMHKAGEVELSRITDPAMVERIREKQKRKPSMSPLPGAYPERAMIDTQAAPAADAGLVADAERWRFYAPKVAALVGMTMDRMTAEIDEARCAQGVV